MYQVIWSTLKWHDFMALCNSVSSLVFHSLLLFILSLSTTNCLILTIIPAYMPKGEPMIDPLNFIAFQGTVFSQKSYQPANHDWQPLSLVPSPIPLSGYPFQHAFEV